MPALFECSSGLAVRGAADDKVTFMRPFLLLPLAVFTGGCAPAEAPKTAARPNIIYILADDLGYGDLSVQGQRHFETPNIDRLASEGIRFTQHYSVSGRRFLFGR